MRTPKKKLLFIMHMPPPVHGAAMMGQYIHDSELINSTFDCKYINMSASKNVDEVGHVNFKKIAFLITNWFAVIRTFLLFKPDLCYITPTSDGWGFYRDFILVQTIKLFGGKIILHFHNKSSQIWIKKSINNRLLKIFFKNVKIILLGKELYTEKSAFISEDNVYYCPNGIESMSGDFIKQNNKKTHFLFLSNMMIEKGVFVLLEACRILKENNYDFQCDFVGGWKDISEQDFNEKVSIYNLQKEVKAYGAKYNKEKNVFFEKSDVFVFPTFYHGETFGLVLLEAMDYSLPCISTINGAIPSVIDDKKTGFCIPQNDSKLLAEKLIWMIEHPQERTLMGINGKKRFDRGFTLFQFEKNICNILDSNA